MTASYSLFSNQVSLNGQSNNPYMERTKLVNGLNRSFKSDTKVGAYKHNLGDSDTKPKAGNNKMGFQNILQQRSVPDPSTHMPQFNQKSTVGISKLGSFAKNRSRMMAPPMVSQT